MPPPDPFHQALTLAAAFRDCNLLLRPPPVRDDDGGTAHYAELTPTGVILLTVTGDPYSLDLYDSLLGTIGARRIAIEPDGRVTVFTYTFDDPVVEPRPLGYYWVRDRGSEWFVAQWHCCDQAGAAPWEQRPHWSVCGSDTRDDGPFDFDEIGPRISEPIP